MNVVLGTHLVVPHIMKAMDLSPVLCSSGTLNTNKRSTCQSSSNLSVRYAHPIQYQRVSNDARLRTPEKRRRGDLAVHCGLTQPPPSLR